MTWEDGGALGLQGAPGQMPPAAMRRFHYTTVESTNDEARRLAARHGEGPLIVTAETQSAGRGRHGREWISPRGGAWMSIAWPMLRPASFYDSVPLVAALALVRAIERLIERAGGGELIREIRVKWPNDILLTGRKVAGVLCERILPARVGEGDDRGRSSPSSCLIIGVGVNADFDEAELPVDALRFPATTLRAVLGAPIDVEQLIDSYSRAMLALMHEFDRAGLTADMLSDLRDRLAFGGCTVQVIHEGGQLIRGRQVGIDDHGRLLLETERGIHACGAGEIDRVRLADGPDTEPH
jgi:BirA family biotin operon repressor/biotin-[acetyl-CoA-carboxylase] ligase